MQVQDVNKVSFKSLLTILNVDVSLAVNTVGKKIHISNISGAGMTIFSNVENNCLGPHAHSSECTQEVDC